MGKDQKKRKKWRGGCCFPPIVLYIVIIVVISPEQVRCSSVNHCIFLAIDQGNIQRDLWESIPSTWSEQKVYSPQPITQTHSAAPLFQVCSHPHARPRLLLAAAPHRQMEISPSVLYTVIIPVWPKVWLAQGRTDECRKLYNGLKEGP